MRNVNEEPALEAEVRSMDGRRAAPHPPMSRREVSDVASNRPQRRSPPRSRCAIWPCAIRFWGVRDVGHDQGPCVCMKTGGRADCLARLWRHAATDNRGGMDPACYSRCGRGQASAVVICGGSATMLWIRWRLSVRTREEVNCHWALAKGQGRVFKVSFVGGAPGFRDELRL